MRTDEIKDNITRYLRLRARKDTLKAELKQVEREIEQETNIIADALLNQGIQSLKLDTGETLSVKIRNYYSLNKNVLEELVNRVIDADYINYLTISPTNARKFIEDNRLTEDKYLSVYQKPTISLRKS